MKKVLLLAVLTGNFSAFAQNVAFNSTGTAANASAMVDISSTTSGLLIPRMTSTQRAAIAGPAQGLTVFDLTTNSFWYHNGTVWTEIGLNNGWRTTGNAGTTIGTNFLGTTDNVSFALRTNNTERIRLLNSGEVVVGSTVPYSGDLFSVFGTYAISAYSTTASAFSIWGEASNATGIPGGFANTNASGTAVLGAGNNVALSTLVAGSGGSFLGTANGLYAYSSSASTGQSIYTSQYGSIVRVNHFNGTQYKIQGAGTVSTVVKDLNNEEVVLHCAESPEIYFTDYGQGQLVNGKAHIDIDPIFAKNVTVNDKHPLRVFIQLEGDCNGVYVTNKTATGFDVVELQNGTSNVSFQWNIVCNRADEVLDNGKVSKNADMRFEKASPKEEVITLPSKRTNNSN